MSCKVVFNKKTFHNEIIKNDGKRPYKLIQNQFNLKTSCTANAYEILLENYKASIYRSFSPHKQFAHPHLLVLAKV